jgi:SNF2 family DNA or RNA helicase
MTFFHSKYYAHNITKHVSSDSIEKLSSSLFNASVDLNPHQLDAALFAFRSPLSRGAILADEVGLGKTIEAGLIISQLWAERKRKILVIAPSTLRKQWAQELIEKFYITSRVFDTREFNRILKSGNTTPLELKDEIVICSYNFVRSKEPEFLGVKWDLVVVDEAHRLRNVYKKGNKIATAITRV